MRNFQRNCICSLYTLILNRQSASRSVSSKIHLEVHRRNIFRLAEGVQTTINFNDMNLSKHLEYMLLSTYQISCTKSCVVTAWAMKETTA